MTSPDAAQAEALGELLRQLSPALPIPPAGEWARIAAAPNTALFVAEENERPVGMLSLAWYDVPSGRKAWIEDVVVDGSSRSRGIGSALLERALEQAARLGATSVLLTSNPARIAARALYRKRGFTEYETTLFRLIYNEP